MCAKRLTQTRQFATALAFALSCAVLGAQQAQITPPDNKYSPAEDVQLGLQAAAEARKQLPIMHDDAVSSYVQNLGRRLVAAVPQNLQHSEFRYSFDVVNVKEINAFALPGGPMFVNRGMIEAARDEGEVAGVMAHELSHVVLRHGTAQQGKATKYAIGQMAGAVLGAIIGGNLGQVVSEGTQFGLGTAFLRFSREYEKQADLEGSHIMAHAGYDPRAMASMFKTIEQQGGAGGPQWLSDHPNPGNRSEYIAREASYLRVDNPVRDSRSFDQVRSHLKGLAPAPTTEQATKNARSGSRGSGPAPGGRVEPPSSRFQTYTEGGLFKVSVPANWQEVQGNNSVTFAPEGAYGQGVFTHGVEFGVARNETHDLQTATNELIDSLAQGNPNMGRPSRYQSITVAGRRGLQTTLSNRGTSGAETIVVVSMLLPDGNLFYAVAVAPSAVFDSYQDTFSRIIGSVQLVG